MSVGTRKCGVLHFGGMRPTARMSRYLSMFLFYSSMLEQTGLERAQRIKAVDQSVAGGQSVAGYRTLFHRRTRASYVYNGCLAWYNVVLTSRVHSSVKFV